MKKVAAKAVRLLVWARTPEGRKDLGALVGVLTAIYTAIHRAGV